MIANIRNWIGWRLATWSLYIATPKYRKFIGGAVRYGMDSALRDQREGLTPPPHWEDRA